MLADGTRVYEQFKDQKLGLPLFNRLIDFAKEKEIKIYRICPFAVKTFACTPELLYLLAEDYLAKVEKKLTRITIDLTKLNII